MSFPIRLSVYLSLSFEIGGGEVGEGCIREGVLFDFESFPDDITGLCCSVS